MVKQSSKSLAQILAAIKKLQNVRGSTSKEIMNYITTEYDLPESTVKRQMRSALKRGVDYGILKKGHGQYCLPAETAAGCQEVATQELGILGLCSKHRSMRSRRGRGRRRRGKRRRRRRRGGRRGRRRRRSRYRRRGGERRVTGDTLKGILRMNAHRPCALCWNLGRSPPGEESAR
ncbi:uncharacterized protein LOC112495395 [Cephus cinctus]|uniref:Uncharacterized protein LOC112495395 n=1 Tax=Cephus cinctus TaxID=211228 RepID=A0AAJ7RUX4_CEPCN|nr:uncharacterized protein LOC112495395 [Cephus cinctus]